MSKENRRLATSIIEYLEGRGVDISLFYPQSPASLVLIGLMHMFAQHNKAPFIDEEDMPMLREFMRKTFIDAQREYAHIGI